MKSMVTFLLFASILACTLAAYHYGYGYPATYGHYGGYYGGLGHYTLGHTYDHGLYGHGLNRFNIDNMKVLKNILIKLCSRQKKIISRQTK
ncbi:hypothetical protein CEXT_466751 [Caerostris extrusa]|uniref:Uncharacterized protein n=1 Tax=Caerostris extrusa TaxID=172846 RepID=A0AAV4WU08_CAEEX|nr:hypothetical protein CEXT_466751 [Caerostris extrusa]